MGGGSIVPPPTPAAVAAILADRPAVAAAAAAVAAQQRANSTDYNPIHFDSTTRLSLPQTPISQGMIRVIFIEMCNITKHYSSSKFY
jgi:hypothetical protein